jgi:hypothetical protein
VARSLAPLLFSIRSSVRPFYLISALFFALSLSLSLSLTRLFFFTSTFAPFTQPFSPVPLCSSKYPTLLFLFYIYLKFPYLRIGLSARIEAATGFRVPNSELCFLGFYLQYLFHSFASFLFRFDRLLFVELGTELFC